MSGFQPPVFKPVQFQPLGAPPSTSQQFEQQPSMQQPAATQLQFQPRPPQPQFQPRPMMNNPTPQQSNTQLLQNQFQQRPITSPQAPGMGSGAVQPQFQPPRPHFAAAPQPQQSTITPQQTTQQVQFQPKMPQFQPSQAGSAAAPTSSGFQPRSLSTQQQPTFKPPSNVASPLPSNNNSQATLGAPTQQQFKSFTPISPTQPQFKPPSFGPIRNPPTNTMQPQPQPPPQQQMTSSRVFNPLLPQQAMQLPPPQSQQHPMALPPPPQNIQNPNFVLPPSQQDLDQQRAQLLTPSPNPLLDNLREPNPTNGNNTPQPLNNNLASQNLQPAPNLDGNNPPPIANEQLPRVAELSAPKEYIPTPGSCPPIANSDYIVNTTNSPFSSPRFMRFSHNNIGDDLVTQTIPNLQFGAITQPLAEPYLGEEQVTVRDVSQLPQQIPMVETSPSNEQPSNGSSGLLSWLGVGSNNNSGSSGVLQSPSSMNPQDMAQYLGPFRCARCYAYANPYFVFNSANNGKTFSCNFCHTEQQTPPHWYCGLDGNHLRMDRFDRYEFSKGSMEYIVPNFYARQLTAPPITNVDPQLQAIQKLFVGGNHRASSYALAKELQQPSEAEFVPHYIFVIDVSFPSLQHGVSQTIISSISQTLQDMKKRMPKARLSVVCYNNTVYIPTFMSYTNREQQVVKDYSFAAMSDIHEPFLPAPAACSFINLHDDQEFELLTRMLQKLPHIFTLDDPTDLAMMSYQTESCFGSALLVAYYLLERRGGKVLSFVSSLPNVGVGSYSGETIQPAIYFTDNEPQLYQHNQFYHMMGMYAAYNSITFDIYSCSTRDNCNLYMFTDLCRLSSGQIYFYRSFSRFHDSEALYHDIKQNLLRNTGFNAVMTVRCSGGLQVGEYYGNCFIQERKEVLLSTIDSHKSIAFSLDYSGKTIPQPPQHLIQQLGGKVFVQVALLFQSILGDTRIRIHTHAVNTVNDIQSIYRQLDPDVIVNLQVKKSTAFSFNPLQCYFYQESTSMSTLETLYAYRKHCARKTSTSQLILPDKLKLLPLYTLGICKSTTFREGVHADERAFMLSYLRSLPCHISTSLFVPRLYELTCTQHLYNIDLELNGPNGPPNPTYAMISQETYGYDSFGEFAVNHTPLYNNNNNNNGHIPHHTERKRLNLPQTLSLQTNQLQDNKIYLLDDTVCIYIWVGPFVPSNFRSLLFDSIESTSYRFQQSQQNKTKIERVSATEYVSVLRPRPKGSYLEFIQQIQAQQRYQLELQQQTPNRVQLAQQNQINPYAFYSYCLLHKIHNIIEYLHLDKSLHQKVHIIHATSTPALADPRKAIASPTPTSVRSMDEINFTRKLIESPAALASARKYSSDSKSWSFKLPNGNTITIQPANTILANQRSCTQSYVDYLVSLHKMINLKTANSQ